MLFRKLCWLVSLIACGLMACNHSLFDSEDQTEPNLGDLINKVNIRVSNQFDARISNVMVNNKSYGRIPARTTTTFNYFDLTANTIELQFDLNGEHYKRTVSHHSSESGLEMGYYTLLMWQFENVILDLRYNYGFVDPEHSQDAEKANLRILNSSDKTFANLVVQNINYGTVRPGETSAYKSFEMIYRYAYIECYIDNELHVLQPIDFVGETPLAKGYYTYKLTPTAEYRSFVLQTVID